MGQGVMYAGQVVKIECLKVKFECLKVKFEFERAEERSTSRGYPSQRMHSKGMYLGLQSSRILVGFGRVVEDNSARSVHARGGSHSICYIVESLGRRGYCVRSELAH